eukprot:1463839-Prorocentrum_lima.AAC.1
MASKDLGSLGTTNLDQPRSAGARLWPGDQSHAGRQAHESQSTPGWDSYGLSRKCPPVGDGLRPF